MQTRLKSAALPSVPPIPAPLLQVTDLGVQLQTVQGPAWAVRDVSFQLSKGETLGIVGESGCGKSMTALALMGLQPEGALVHGRIDLAGSNLTALDERDWCKVRGKQMGMVFQEPMTALNPLHTIGQQICEPLKRHGGMNRADARAKALQLLESVALPQARERLDAYPHQLSGGQRQRVGIAIALACEPQILVADEPTTALDVTIQSQILQLIEDLIAQRGMGLILISHDLRLIARRVQRVAVMYGGSIVETGPTDDVFTRPQHPYTRGLLGARPTLHGVRGRRLEAIAGTVPAITELGRGCTFADRCGHRQVQCQNALPPLLATSSLAMTLQSAVRCVRAKDIDLQAAA